jgi:NAD+ diphosphatase
MFSGNPLNRLSWLRPSHAFLNNTVVSPSTRWIIFKGGDPLVSQSLTDPEKNTLAYLSTHDVASLLGPEPFFGQAENVGQLASDTEKVLESARHRGVPIVFLGTQERHADVSLPNLQDGTIQGTPFFAMDVADVEPERVDAMLQAAAGAHPGLTWVGARAILANLEVSTAGVFAQARSMVDWNQRNKARAPVLSTQESLDV